MLRVNRIVKRICARGAGARASAERRRPIRSSIFRGSDACENAKISSKDGRSRDARLRWLLGRECGELRHDASYRSRPSRRPVRGRARVVSKRSHLRFPRLTFSGFFAAFDAGGFVALSARSALTKLHTPVPCMVSVAPTAYRAPSNAVLMDQKMGAISTGVGAFGRSCRAREMWRIAMTCRLRTRKRPAHIARGFLAPIGDFFFWRASSREFPEIFV